MNVYVGNVRERAQLCVVSVGFFWGEASHWKSTALDNVNLDKWVNGCCCRRGGFEGALWWLA